jgi:hypothetical protein
VGQFFDALKTSIISGLAFGDLGEKIVRMMVLLFWITYNRCSRHKMLLQQIPPQFMIRKSLIKFRRFSMLLKKDRRI